MSSQSPTADSRDPPNVQVGSGSLVSFPVQVGTGNRTQSAADAQALVRDLIFTSYAIGFVRLDAIKLVRDPTTTLPLCSPFCSRYCRRS